MKTAPSYEEAKAYLEGSVRGDGGLQCRVDAPFNGYLDWDPGDGRATLDGMFTADDLLAIATYMRGS